MATPTRRVEVSPSTRCHPSPRPDVVPGAVTGGPCTAPVEVRARRVAWLDDAAMEQPGAQQPPVAERGPVRGRRRGPQWTRVGYGLYRPSDDSGLATVLGAWQLALPPSGRFTHLTAARAYGWWLPPLPDDLPVFAAQDRAESRPQRPELRVFRHDRLPEPVVVDGIRLDPPPQVLLACARHLSLVDLVVLVDAALHLHSSSADDLAREAGCRRRGAPLLRRALRQVDARSESAWETLLRLLHRSCGIDVEPQHPLRDEHGTEVARADLWLRGTTAIHEYDGEHHLTRRRQRKDLARSRRIGNVDWTRRGYTSSEVLHQAVGILRDADLSLDREHRPERVRRWHALLADSLFTPSGEARLRRLLHLEPVTGGWRHQDSA